MSQVPQFEEKYDEICSKGVDEVVCVSVNDAFVMYQWGQKLGVKKVTLLPDGNGEFTRKMGMLVDKSNVGFGMRSWRYAMVVRDGEIEKMFVEEGFSDNFGADPFCVSDAATVLAYLNEK